MKMALGVDGSDKVDKLVNVNSDNSKQSNLVGASGKIGWKSTLTVLVIAVILIGIISSQSGSQDDWNSKKEEISSNIQESTAEDSWIPTGYSLWSKNPPIAIKVLSPNSYDCGYYDRCFGIMIISKDGCPNNLYGEVQLLNKSGVQIGYTNEVLSSSLPLQKSKMIFGTYERDTYQFQVSKISCY
jgi:hypothetical protein